MRRTTRRIALGAIGASLALGCSSDPRAAPPANTETTTINEHQARSLALKHYRNLTRGLHMRHPRTGELMPFPDLTEDYFQHVESLGDVWLVRAEPPAGWTVIMRVDKKGDWVEVLRWSFAPA